MQKITFNILLLGALSIFFFIKTGTVFAQANNKFGFHLSTSSHEDIKEIAQIVNSNGGEWGYITLVIQENDRNGEKWQNTFNLLREQKLIPIIRLATRANGDFWERGSLDEVENWVSFLDGLNWPTKHRYVVLFNEPNHASEWGGSCDPKNYFEVANVYAQKLHNRHDDFFVMLAGLDQAAPQISPRFCSAHYFLTEGSKGVPEIWNHVDGLASHSYPNPGYVGSPNDTGWKSVVGYINELDLVHQLGAKPDMKVFITETGYPTGSSYFVETIANEYLQKVISIWNQDSRVQAFTIFDYHIAGALKWFSYKGESYAKPTILATLVGWQKTKGEPPMVESAVLVENPPSTVAALHTITINLNIKNIGQTTWDPELGYDIKISGAPFPLNLSLSKAVKPGEVVSVAFDITPTIGQLTLPISLTKNNQVIAQIFDWSLLVKQAPKIEVSVEPIASQEVILQVFDANEKLQYEKTHKLINGSATISDFLGKEGEQYRIVMLQDKFLPTQKHFVLGTKNIISLGRSLGVDLNGDGKFSWEDFF